jgi:hypothetical protein
VVVAAAAVDMGENFLVHQGYPEFADQVAYFLFYTHLDFQDALYNKTTQPQILQIQPQ